MKKKLTGILSAALALTIPFAVACNGGGNGGGEWWSTTGELEKNGDEIVFNDVGLRLASIVAGDDKEALNQIVAQFNAEYSGKIRVSVTTVGYESFEDYVARSVKQGDKSAPDIVMGHQSSVKAFLDYKVIQLKRFFNGHQPICKRGNRPSLRRDGGRGEYGGFL